MRAIELFEFGDADRLRLVDIPAPRPGPGQVLVEVEAAGVQFIETVERAGRGFSGMSVPAIFGSEVAGKVVALGPDTAGPAVGTRVMAPLLEPGGAWRRGGYAEFVPVAACYAMPLPATLRSAESVALLNQGMTAYLMAYKAAQVHKGDTVLVHSAAGGVGTLLVQMSRLLGASKVIGTASTQAKRDYVTGLGADIVLDSRSPNWPAQVLEATDGKGVTLIFESLGGEEGLRNLECLAAYGRMLVYGFASGGLAPIKPEQFFQLLIKNQSIAGFGCFDWLREVPVVRGILQDLIDLRVSGKLKLTTVEFPFSEAPAAHRELEERRISGKVVLVPGERSNP